MVSYVVQPWEKGLLTFKMPGHMAMQNPHPWIVRLESKDDVGLLWDGKGITTHGLFEIPSRSRRGRAGIATRTPAYYLNSVAYIKSM